MWEIHFNNTLLYMQVAMAANHFHMLYAVLLKLMPGASWKNSVTYKIGKRM